MNTEVRWDNTPSRATSFQCNIVLKPSHLQTFISSFNQKYFLSMYQVLQTVLNSEGAGMKKTDKTLSSRSLHFIWSGKNAEKPEINFRGQGYEQCSEEKKKTSVEVVRK